LKAGTFPDDHVDALEEVHVRQPTLGEQNDVGFRRNISEPRDEPGVLLASKVLVHHDNVGAQLLDDAHGLEPAPRFCRYLETVLFEDEPQKVPQQRTSIGDDDTYRCDPDSSR
jgi:hypothetical protein